MEATDSRSRLASLQGQLCKRHSSSKLGSLNNAASRFYECDDRLGLLLCYKNKEDHLRRLPHRCFSIGDISGVELHAKSSSMRKGLTCFVTHSFQIHFSSDCDDLVLGSFKAADAARWTSGLQQRMGSTVSRLVRLGEAKQPSAGADALAQVKEAFGLSVRNLEWSPIGVEISDVLPGSLADKASLVEGDVLVAVGRDVCLSYKHACNLLVAAGLGPATKGELVQLVVSHNAGSKTDRGLSKDAFGGMTPYTSDAESGESGESGEGASEAYAIS